MLLQETKLDDMEDWKNYLQLRQDNSVKLETIANEDVKMKNTLIRDTIPGNLKFPATKHSFPTGQSKTYLVFAFSIHQTTFSKFIPKICKTLHVMKIQFNTNTMQNIIYFS